MRVLKLAASISLLLCSASLRVQGQSWKNLANKAKRKAQQAAGVPSSETANGTTQNGQTTHYPATQPWYMFCTDAGASFTIHYSAIFPLAHDPNTFLADSATWKAFAKEQYGIPGESHATCEQFPTEQQARDKKAHYQKAQTRTGDTTINDINCTPTAAPSVSPDVSVPATSGSAATSSPTASASVSASPGSMSPPTRGPVVYTYCFLSLKTPHKTYVSDVFPIHKQDRNTLYATYPKFAQAVADQYQVMTVGRGHVGGYGCEDGFDTEQKAITRRAADLARYQSNPQMEGAVEVAWKGEMSSPETSLSTPQKNLTGPAGDPTRAAIEEEHRGLPRFCQQSIQLVYYYDCSCFANKVTEEHMKGGTTIAHAAGGRPVINPQLGALISKLDLRSCASPDAITTYITKNTMNNFYSLSPERKQALATCASKKMIYHLQTDPQGQLKIDNFASQDYTDCNQGK